MRAMVMDRVGPAESHPLKLTDMAVAKPRPGELLIRVRACGVCRTDLHLIEGELPTKKLPLIPGHQVVGIVEGRGQGVTEFIIGERVGVGWVYRTCGSCRFCKNGRENLCETAEFTGYTRDGGYADYLVVDESFAHRLPRGLDDIHTAPLLCAGVIGYRAYSTTRVNKGDTLGLVGFGSSAHIIIQVAKYFGVKVFVFSRGREHRQLAREMGADWIGGTAEKPPATLTAAILFAPVGTLVPEVLKNLDRGGRLVIDAIHLSPISQLDYSLLWPERQLLNVANGTRQDAREFIKLAGQIPISTHVSTFPLTAANEALLRMKQSRVGGSVVLVP